MHRNSRKTMVNVITVVLINVRTKNVLRTDQMVYPVKASANSLIFVGQIFAALVQTVLMSVCITSQI